jgi:hypothetical protein
MRPQGKADYVAEIIGFERRRWRGLNQRLEYNCLGCLPARTYADRGRWRPPRGLPASELRFSIPMRNLAF